MTILDGNGIYGANTSSPSKHPMGATIAGRTDGAIGSTGYVSELAGSVSNGTGGFTYKITNTPTSVSTSPVSIVSVTLNKGIYLISAIGRCYGVATVLQGDIRIGGTLVTTTGIGQNAMGVSFSGSYTLTLPVIITADSTVVALYGSIGSGTASSSYTGEMFVMRIA